MPSAVKPVKFEGVRDLNLAGVPPCPESIRDELRGTAVQQHSRHQIRTLPNRVVSAIPFRQAKRSGLDCRNEG